MFAFLEEDHGFSIAGTSCAGATESITYVNITKSVAVKLEYEIMAALVYVMIYKLADGQMLETDSRITDDSIITCFDFAYVLPAKERVKPAYKYGENSKYYDEQNGLRNYVAEYAARLRKYGKDLLSGNFAVLPKVEKMIKRRARKDLAED